MHGVPIKVMKLLEEEDKIIHALLSENDCWEDAEICHVGWLINNHCHLGKKESSIIIKFTNPRPANQAINLGTIWDLTLHNMVLYDQAARIYQCYNC